MLSYIAKKEGVYIPPNLHRGVRISFHIDNFDEQIVTFDGKNSVSFDCWISTENAQGSPY